MNLMQIYDKLPVALQNLACTLQGRKIEKKRYGTLFEKIYADYMSRDNWSYEQLCEYRDRQIQKLVKHCYQTVPYYKKLFDEGGINFECIKGLEDLKQIPILTKQTVKDNFNDFISTQADKMHLIQMHTSGTTGSGFRFLTTVESDTARWADAWRGNRRFGLTRDLFRGYFGGRKIVPLSTQKPPFYRIDKDRQIIFSTFHLKEDFFSNYIEGLNRYRPPWIHAYPNAIISLVQYMLDRDIRLSYPVKFVTLSSENVTEAMEQKIHKVFGVRPYQSYAQAEQVATFRQNKDYEMYVSEDIAAAEFVPLDGEVCKIIGTNLTNYAMPLLRYDTKDLAVFKETEKGRKIVRLDGRDTDYVFFRNNERRNLTLIFSDLEQIVASQIVQKSLDLIEFHIVRSKNYTKQDENALIQSIEKNLCGKIGYQIVYVDHIPKTAGGKMKFIVSELPKEV